MVKNLGNSYAPLRSNQMTKLEYNPNDSEINVSKMSRNDIEFNSINAKCEYLETLNSNLVQENNKLKYQIGAGMHKTSMTDHKTSQDTITRSHKDHLLKIKSDYDAMIEETKYSCQREYERLNSEWLEKESELLARLN